jgi:predicted nucleic acid-binding protein
VSYLLDTDVLSEGAKPRPDAVVLAWLEANEAGCYTSAIVLAEITRGVARLPSGRRKERLQLWLEDLRTAFGARALPFDSAVAKVWGELLADLEPRGLLPPHPDSYLLATAKQHGLTLATRNISNYAGRGVPVFNPFTGKSH